MIALGSSAMSFGTTSLAATILLAFPFRCFSTPSSDFHLEFFFLVIASRYVQRSFSSGSSILPPRSLHTRHDLTPSSSHHALIR